jgi:hypothetical protein
MPAVNNFEATEGRASVPFKEFNANKKRSSTRVVPEWYSPETTRLNIYSVIKITDQSAAGKLVVAR